MEIIGHRGAKGLAPENTLRSLQSAIKHNVDMIEFDVRVTEDHVAVLLHDPVLTDAAGQQLVLAEHSFPELKQHKPDLTTLTEALDCIDSKVRAYIEVKPGEPVQPVIKVLKSYLGGRHNAQDLLLGSKSQKTLMGLHRALPEVPKIVIEPWSGLRARWRARQLRTKLVAMNQHWLWRGFITPVARGGWQLYAYTVNDPQKAKRWAGYGLAGVITDYPDRFES